MSLLVGKQAPDFSEKAVIHGDEVVENFGISQFKGKYIVLFFYPLDFTFVCPTELHAFQTGLDVFKSLNTEVIAVSTDSWFSHLAWLNVPKEKGGIQGVKYPIVADFNKKIASDYGVLLDGGMALRGTFLIDKNQIVQHQLINNLDLGRNVEETLRTLRTLQHTEKHGEVCPANWVEGDEGMKTNTDSLKEYFSKK